jgi:hypothetical protein
MTPSVLIPMVLAAYTMAVQPADAASFPLARATNGVSALDASVVASERPIDASAMPSAEDEMNLGGAIYSPFAQAATPVQRDRQPSRNGNAQAVDLTFSALTTLAAFGVLIYLVRRAWAT